MPVVCLTKKNPQAKKIIRQTVSLLAKPLWDIIPKSLYEDISIQHLSLALTRVCNANCVFCPYQLAKHEEKIHMRDNVFEKVLVNIKEAKIGSVMLSPDLGEPLVAPNFIDKVKKLRKNGIKLIEMTTNASLLNEVGIDAILKDGPDKINISFPGFDKDMYERVCRVPLYDKTRSNILKILKRNHSMGNPKTINVWLEGILVSMV